MKNKIVGLIVVTTLMVSAVKTMAVEEMFFDSTDRYLGACQLTNKSEWKLDKEAAVSKFEVWYSWNQGETELPVKLFKDGQIFAEFKATRSSCDPYQHQWCNADYSINKIFPAGKYSTEIPYSRQCLKPGGTGAIRLYREMAAETTIAVTPTTTPTAAPTPTITVRTEVVEKTVTTTSCDCNRTEIVTSAAATSGIVSMVIWLVLKRK